jgi:hypothetical protein
MLKKMGVPVPNEPKVAGAMTFIYALEAGPRDNPFQIKRSSGVTPKGPDRGFTAAMKAHQSRIKAMQIDSAPALGIAWFLPALAERPTAKIRYLDPRIVRENKGLFNRARYFGDDAIAVTASYTVGALERMGVPVKYTPAFVALMRAVVEHDLSSLKQAGRLSTTEAERRFLDMVRTRYGQGAAYTKLGFSNLSELLDTARNLYRATRLSTIGQHALGGGR